MNITDIENSSLFAELTPEEEASIQGGGLPGIAAHAYLTGSGTVVGNYLGGPAGGAVGTYLGNKVGEAVEKSPTATGAVLGYAISGPIGGVIGGFIGSLW